MIPLVASPDDVQRIQPLALQWGLVVRERQKKDRFILELVDDRLQLSNCDDNKIRPVSVDFTAPQTEYRRKFGGGRRQAIARAVGLRKGAVPAVVDATAGLGRDAFVLASLGCQVHMLERIPTVAALLADGLRRAKLDPEIGSWVAQRLTFNYQDSCRGFSGLPFPPDVIYLDPMFPEKKKSALVKKEMRILQAVIGEDKDSDQLFQAAVASARQRVVVKRPVSADYLARRKPNVSIKTKNHRFDIYLIPEKDH